MPRYQSSGRKLRANASTALPRYLIALDTETVPKQIDQNGRKFAHKFRLGVAISARITGVEPSAIDTHYLEHPYQFWQLLERFTKPNQTTWVVAHNALFDLVVAGMGDQFEQSKLVIEWPRQKRHKENNRDDNDHCYSLCVIESPPTIIAAKVVSTGGRVVFVDTLNYFMVPLKELGEACGLRKLPMPTFDEPDIAWFTYCERDARIVFETFCNLLKWVKENDFGMFRYTGPSQAMAAYRHRFANHTIYFHDNEPIKKIERASYFGGRSEVFRLGEISTNVHQFDCNALFPFIMLKQQFPVVLDRFEIRDNYLELFPNCNFEQSLAEVELLTWNNCFPLRDSRGVIYPIGRFRTTLCGKELEYAYRHQFITKIRSWAQYRCEPIFSGWVDELWRMRQLYKHSGNELYEKFVKMLMNSLYGKFAQLSPSWVNVKDYFPCEPWTNWHEYDTVSGNLVQYRSFGWQTQRCDNREEIPNTLVAISAFVTSAARVYMNEVRSIIGTKECYYQGVDGLIVTDTGKLRLENSGLVDEDKLGCFRHQLSTNYGVINGVSDYRLGDKVIIAGRAIKHGSDELAENLQRQFHVLNNLFGGCSVNYVIEKLSEWRKVSTYWKGKPGADGWVTPVSYDDCIQYDKGKPPSQTQ